MNHAPVAQRIRVRAASGSPQGSPLLQTSFAKMWRRGRASVTLSSAEDSVQENVREGIIINTHP